MDKGRRSVKPYYEKDGIVIYHGDCREILPTLPRASVDMIWTDPPYGHDNGSGDLAASRVGVGGGRKATLDTIANDSPEAWETLMPKFLELAEPILKPDRCCCCCCCGGGGPSPSFARLALWIDERLAFFHAVVWDKSGRGR